MTRPYSTDLRERVVRAVEAGASRRSVAAQFDVSVSFVIKLMQRWRQRGTVAADQYGGWRRAILASHADRVHALVAEKSDITLEELRVRLARDGVQIGRSALASFLVAQGLTRKKRHSMPPSRIGRT